MSFQSSELVSLVWVQLLLCPQEAQRCTEENIECTSACQELPLAGIQFGPATSSRALRRACKRSCWAFCCGSFATGTTRSPSPEAGGRGAAACSFGEASGTTFW